MAMRFVTLAVLMAALPAWAQVEGHRERAFDVWIVQNGRALTPVGDEVTLKRQPFDLMMRIRPGIDAVHMHASPNADVYARAVPGEVLTDVFRGGNSMATDGVNANRQLIIDEEDVSAWTTGEHSGFNEIRRVGRAVEGKNVVAFFAKRIQSDLTPVAKWKGRELHLVFNGISFKGELPAPSRARLKLKFR